MVKSGLEIIIFIHLFSSFLILGCGEQSLDLNNPLLLNPNTAQQNVSHSIAQQYASLPSEMSSIPIGDHFNGERDDENKMTLRATLLKEFPGDTDFRYYYPHTRHNKYIYYKPVSFFSNDSTFVSKSDAGLYTGIYYRQDLDRISKGLNQGYTFCHYLFEYESYAPPVHESVSKGSRAGGYSIIERRDIRDPLRLFNDANQLRIDIKRRAYFLFPQNEPYTNQDLNWHLSWFISWFFTATVDHGDKGTILTKDAYDLWLFDVRFFTVVEEIQKWAEFLRVGSEMYNASSIRWFFPVDNGIKERTMKCFKRSDAGPMTWGDVAAPLAAVLSDFQLIETDDLSDYPTVGYRGKPPYEELK